MAEGGSDIETKDETERLITPEVSVISAGTINRTPLSVVPTVTVTRVSQCSEGSDKRGHSDRITTCTSTTRASPIYSTQTVDDEIDEGDAEAGASRPSTHCHAGRKKSGLDKKARKKLIVASVLCLAFMIGEVVGGLLAHSLAVVSDAAHMLTDVASFMISLLAIYLAGRPATKRLSFGWHRAEVLGALVSILLLWVLTVVLVQSAVERIQSGDYEINATIMLITSAVGVGFNVVLGCTLHQHGHSHGGGGGHSHGNGGHSHDDQSEPTLPAQSERSPLIDGQSADATSSVAGGYGSVSSDVGPVPKAPKKKSGSNNINIKAAFIHVLGDFCQSVGVLVAAIIIYFKPEWKIADPICTFLFSVFVLITTFTIVRDIFIVLMEGTPRSINFEEVRDSILDLDGVKDLHDLRLWSLTMDKTAMSVHLVVERAVEPMQVVRAASYMIRNTYNISQTAIQVEEYEDEMNDCTRCQEFKD